LETLVDRRKIVGGSRTSAFATQFVEASADHRKIISSSGSGHISSPVSVASGSWAIRVARIALSFIQNVAIVSVVDRRMSVRKAPPRRARRQANRSKSSLM